MIRKQDESHKRKAKPPNTPSTGRGAASALDALIKRRVSAPGPGQEPPPVSTKKR
jgi:hypothetical protein